MPMKTARRPIEAPSTARWENTIVLCAANRWDTVKLADRHMAERLSAHAPVLYVDPPVSHLTRLINPAIATALDGPRLRIVAPNIARYTPVVPPKPMHPAVVRSTEYVIRRELRNTIAQLGGDVRAVVSTWLFVNVYGFLGEQHRVYWWQDDPIGAADHWGASAARLAAADERLGRSSDLVVAVNEGAVERWRQRGVRTEFLPNGCDIESFADDDLDCPSDVTLPHPIAGFVGHINSRTDLSLLESVATGGTSLLLIGPKDPLFEPERFRRLTERPNVSWLGARRFEELPPYLSAMDVGLVPYGATEFNRFSFPMKTLEYLAAGLPVVSTSLPAVRWLDTPLVSLADDAADFARAVREAGALDKSAELVAQRRSFAEQHSWDERAARLAELVELT